MDIADRAYQDIETIERLVKRPAPKREAEATGKCLWCGKPLKGDRRWCNAVCRDMWQEEQDGRRTK